MSVGSPYLWQTGLNVISQIMQKMARGMEHGLVEAVTFVTLATHLTKSDSNKSAVAKMALVLSLAVIPTNTIIFFELSNPL